MAVLELGSSADGNFWGHTNFIEQVGLAGMPRAFWMASSFSPGAVHRRTLSCRPPCLLRHDGDALLGAHDAQQLRPAHVYAFLFQHIFGDGHDPVGQYGQMEVGLGAFVGPVVYRAYVKIQFQSLECLFHGSLITSQAGTPAYQHRRRGRPLTK